MLALQALKPIQVTTSSATFTAATATTTTTSSTSVSSTITEAWPDLRTTLARLELLSQVFLFVTIELSASAMIISFNMDVQDALNLRRLEVDDSITM